MAGRGQAGGRKGRKQSRGGSLSYSRHSPQGEDGGIGRGGGANIAAAGSLSCSRHCQQFLRAQRQPLIRRIPGWANL